MENFVNNLIDNKINNIHTCMPCEIKKVNLASVDIKPLFYKYTESGQKINHPLIREVPVINVSTQNAEIKMPVSAGDKGLYLICERDISNILKGGKEIESTRKFDLSDGFFIPTNFGSGSKVNTKNIEVINNQTEIVLSPDGKIKIKGISDLLDLISQILDIFLKNSANFGNVIDPQSGAPIPNNLAATSIPVNAQEIKAKIKAMRLK